MSSVAVQLHYRPILGQHSRALPAYHIIADFAGQPSGEIPVGKVKRFGSLPSMQTWTTSCPECPASFSDLRSRGRAARLLAEHYAERHLNAT